ncbi:MAG: glycosyltransferase [Desulfomonilaceae bacterium]
MSEKPQISIIMCTLNGERFLRTALESLVAQSYDSWELVVVDGASSDGTLDVIAGFRHPNIKVFSEPDEGPVDALFKGLKLARGDYFMFLCASDGYIDKDWLASCVGVLDSDPEVSLVWGVPARCTEDGVIGPPHYAFAQFLKKGGIISRLVSRYFCGHSPIWVPSPIKSQLLGFVGFNDVQKQDWFSFWLQTGLAFPDLNVCLRRIVIDRCMPPYRAGAIEIVDFWFNINAQGFLPYCIPCVANFGRTHRGQLSEAHAKAQANATAEYFAKIAALRDDLRAGHRKHVFVDGSGRSLNHERNSLRG